jgi:hypothetical protein
VRWSAAVAICSLGDFQAVPGLLVLLYDSDSEVHEFAFGKLGDTQAVPDLLTLLKDSDSRVRGFAAVALGKLGDTQVVPEVGLEASEAIKSNPSMLILLGYTILRFSLNNMQGKRICKIYVFGPGVCFFAHCRFDAKGNTFERSSAKG